MSGWSDKHVDGWRDGWMDTCERAEDLLIDLILRCRLEGGAGGAQQLHPVRTSTSEYAVGASEFTRVCL